MRMRKKEGLVESFRRLLLAEQTQRLARLEGELAEIRRALRQPAVSPDAVFQALREVLATRSDDVAAALEPLLPAPEPRCEEKKTPPPRASLAPILVGAGLLIVAFVLATYAELATGLRPAAAEATASEVTTHALAVFETAQGQAAKEAEVSPCPVVLEQRDDGFGLGEARMGDEEIARQVRERLARCDSLAQARVSFSVKDGWVWLRGEASAAAREEAEASLADLGEDVMVVNQLVVVPATDMLAGRSSGHDENPTSPQRRDRRF